MCLLVREGWMVTVLGISIWIHFIWIFIMGVLLFFHLVHDGFHEGFQLLGGSGSGSLQNCDPGYASGSGSSAVSWPSTLTYQQRLNKGQKLVSPNGMFVLLFRTDGALILYRKSTCAILWRFDTGSSSSYLVNDGAAGYTIKNTNGTLGPSPFPALAATDNTTFLQVQDDANLAIKKPDGTALWGSGTIIVLADECNPTPMSYPFQSSDCFNLQTQISVQNAKIAEFKAAGNSIQAAAAKKVVCNLQQYYNNINLGKTGVAPLSCDTYLSGTTPAAAAPPPLPLSPPSGVALGSIVNNATAITIAGDLTTSVKSGDMIYLGYGTDIQGPFVVLSVTSTAINITKPYVGTDINNAILSVKAAARTAANMPEISPIPSKMQIGDIDILASIYPGESYIVIGSTSNTDYTADSASDSLPYNINLGDIVYVKKDTCNMYDVDNGDGTCTAYTCKIGEKDIGNNQCKPYMCGYTNIGTIGQPNNPQDTDNGDGTCTTRQTFNECGGSDSYSVALNTCTGSTSNGNSFTYARGVRTEAFRYDKTENTNPSIVYQVGIPGTSYNKTNYVAATGLATAVPGTTNPRYKYSKTIGPYVVAATPSTNKIMIKSFVAGDLDSHGAFLLNPTAQWRRFATLWPKYKVGPVNTPNLFQTLENLGNALSAAPAIAIGALPLPADPIDIITPTTTVNLKALPEGGLLDAKLYPLKYNDGQFNGSFTSLTAGTGAANRRLVGSTSLKIDSSAGSSDSIFNISNINLIVGQNYIVTVTVKSIDPVTTAALAAAGSSAGSSLGDAALRASAALLSFEYAANQSYPIPGNFGPLSGGSATTTAPTGLLSTSITCSFTALSTTLAIHVYKANASPLLTFEFSKLTIIGGVIGATGNVPCPAGYYCNVSTVTGSGGSGSGGSGSGGSGSGGSSTGNIAYSVHQIPCPPSMSCPQGMSSPCPIGSFATFSASDVTCTPCPTGQVPFGDFTSCITCPVGTIVSGNTCSRCPINQTSSADHTSCVNCPAGKASDPNGIYTFTGICVQCANGRISVGGARCMPCPIANNTVSNADNTMCICAAGYYLTASTCAPCPAGSYSAAGASSCTPCPANTAASTTGNSSCSTCPSGTSSYNLSGGVYIPAATGGTSCR